VAVATADENPISLALPPAFAKGADDEKVTPKPAQGTSGFA
jgi:hypothetical protein